MEICIFIKFKNMFDKILNEETGRFLTNFFGFNFSIFSNEGNTPHFHFLMEINQTHQMFLVAITF